MESIDEKIKTWFSIYNENIRKNKIKNDKEYFKQTTGMEFSIDEHIEMFKKQAKNNDDEQLDGMFTVLEKGYLFSVGHDFMYRKSMRANNYTTPLMESLFLPIFTDKVKTVLRNSKILKLDPKSREVVETIFNILCELDELQTIFNELYAGEFSNGLEMDIKDSRLLRLMNKYGITVSKYLHALVDEKCNLMVSVFENIQDEKLKEKYLNMVEDLRKRKHKEIDSFPMSPLPIQIFFHYTMEEIMDIIANNKDINKYLIVDNDDSPKRKS